MEEVKINLGNTNNKHKCEDCGKSFRHIEKCKDGKFRCKNCKKKQITNKWFIPKDKRNNDKVSRFSMSNQEKSLLNKQGHSWKEINGACKYMKKVSWSKRKQYWNKKKLEQLNKQKDTEQMKKLIEGLKQ